VPEEGSAAVAATVTPTAADATAASVTAVGSETARSVGDRTPSIWVADVRAGRCVLGVISATYPGRGVCVASVHAAGTRTSMRTPLVSRTGRASVAASAVVQTRWRREAEAFPSRRLVAAAKASMAEPARAVVVIVVIIVPPSAHPG
jgi:hypothetical protein